MIVLGVQAGGKGGHHQSLKGSFTSVDDVCVGRRQAQMRSTAKIVLLVLMRGLELPSFVFL